MLSDIDNNDYKFLRMYHFWETINNKLCYRISSNGEGLQIQSRNNLPKRRIADIHAYKMHYYHRVQKRKIGAMYM